MNKTYRIVKRAMTTVIAACIPGGPPHRTCRYCRLAARWMCCAFLRTDERRLLLPQCWAGRTTAMALPLYKSRQSARLGRPLSAGGPVIDGRAHQRLAVRRWRQIAQYIWGSCIHRGGRQRVVSLPENIVDIRKEQVFSHRRGFFLDRTDPCFMEVGRITVLVGVLAGSFVYCTCGFGTVFFVVQPINRSACSLVDLRPGFGPPRAGPCSGCRSRPPAMRENTGVYRPLGLARRGIFLLVPDHP